MKYCLYSLVLMVCVAACSTNSEMPGPKEGPKDPFVESFIFDVVAGTRPIDTNPDEWILDEQLSDQFGSENILSKWNKDTNDWGPWSWEPRNAYQEDGKLNLQLSYKEHTARDMNIFYTSGIVRSLDTITYGFVEARIKGIPIYPAASPAFWLYTLGGELDDWGLRGTNEGDVRYAEIDVVELTQGNWDPITQDRFPPELMDCNLHVAVMENGAQERKYPSDFPELLKTEYTSLWDPRDDFHTYGADITPDSITFYIDGEAISIKENVYWHLPMHLTLSLGLRYPHVTYNNCPDGLWRCPVPEAATPEGYPVQMQVDWVRAYRKK